MEVVDPANLVYNDSLFSTCLLQNLEAMRSSGSMCDVTLVVNQVEITAHKVVLAAASPYFRAMLCTEMKESASERIDMRELDHTILKEIVDFFYTSEIKICEDNVYSVMELADFLQVSSLRKACSHFLEATLTPDNCLSTHVRASMGDYPDLAHAAFRFALRNFRAVVEEEEFVHAPADIILRLLDSRLLNVQDETQVLQSVLRWIKHCPSERLELAERLVAKVDLGVIPTEALLAAKIDPALTQSALPALLARTIATVTAERYDHGNPWADLRKRAKKQRYSQEQEVLLALGGQSVGMAVGSVECFTLGYDKWKCVVPAGTAGDARVVPTMRRARIEASAVAQDYRVAVLGGRDGAGLMSSVEEYDVQSNAWRDLPELPLPLSALGAVALGGRLHVFGGRSQRGASAHCWALDPGADSWRSLPPMSRGRASAGTVAVGGSVYVFGGIGPDDSYLTCAERYDPCSRSWFRIAPLRERRARFGCVAVDEFVYLIGGHDGTFWLKTVDRYNTLTNEWASLSPMGGSRSDFSATVCDRRIYCIGGFDSIRPLASVEKYNPRTDRWHCVTSMRQHRVSLCSATLHVPVASPGPI